MSPVRRLGDLQLSDVRIQMKTLDAVRQNVPVDALDLYKAIRRIGTGRRVIPQAVKPLASAVLDACELDDLNFDDTADDRRAPAHEEQWRGVHEVLDAARECQECGLFEAAWNSEVHSRVLRLALQRGRNDTGVWYRDMTAARISDKSMLPVSASGVAAQGKTVDYALILDTAWDKDLWRRVIATLRRRDELTINQTEAEHVRFSPIAVSIETKRDLVEGDAAILQLSVWVSAHFRRLQQLTDARIPTMPLIIVQGHEWKLLLAEYSVEEGELVMYWMLNLGATHSILGTYQLIASLRQLTKWISETYRPWFEREVLAPASADDG
ncbi:hypothetical protein SLS56_012132 [Neofusicoccum ribis]|uniref:PD-(D/E)XK nuclease-like domain-containing protein n=1 Tax=Neofusicoccum ribis TaxID=45134 RepID=A0ABR3S9Z4_9PEZI